MQTANRKFDELAAFVLSQYGNQRVLLQPYEYQLPTTAAIAAGTTAAVSVKISGNADFWMYEGSLYSDLNVDDLGVQMVDTGSNEQIASGPLLQNYVDAREMFALENTGSAVPTSAQLILPKRFAMNATVTVSFTNRGAGNVAAVYSAIRGVLAYPLN